MRAWLAWVGVVLALFPTPLARAEPARADVTSPGSIVLQGEVSATFGDAQLTIEGWSVEGAATLQVAAGTVQVLTWHIANAQPQNEIRLMPPLDRAEVETFKLHNGNVTVALDAEHFVARANAAPGALVLVGGRGIGEGKPTWIPRDMSYGDETMGLAPENVHWAWRRGWPFVGDVCYQGEYLLGYPRMDLPRIQLRGPALVLFEGGNVSFQDAAGGTRAYRLGNYSESPEANMGLGPNARVQTYRRLIFDGELASSDLPSGTCWGVAGPEVTWRLDGRARWTGATGRILLRDREVAFEDALVEARGILRIEPTSQGLLQPLASARYAVEGEWSSIVVDGRLVFRPPLPVEAVGGVPLAAALVAFLFERPREIAARAVARLYTRLSAGELLDHPQRARIHTILQEEPGIHLKELHRRVGGGWGTFRFHVRLLHEGGYLKLERAGRYLIVRRVGATGGGFVIPNPVARRIFGSLPVDGTTLAPHELAQRAGVSRQLLQYHLGNLRRLGAIAETTDALGARRIGRASPAVPADRGETPIAP